MMLEKGSWADYINVASLFRFSAKDQDNDTCEFEGADSCSEKYGGGWWYHNCYQSNLNGKFYKNDDAKAGRHNGLVWEGWKGRGYSLKKVEMKIRPKDTR